MRVLFLSAEVEPMAKVGGLADVAGSLPVALREKGHDAIVAMPAYRMVLDDPRWSPVRTLSGVKIRVSDTLSLLADLYEFEHEGLTVWLVGGGSHFSSVARSEDVYTPGRDAYLFFAQAVIELCKAKGWRPDLIHANDWHMGFAPAMLREKTDWEETASVFTIHNLAYQGQFGPDTVEASGLPWESFTWDRLETWGGVNFLKTGCAYADQVNTVSPTYAQEIQTEEFGCGLWGLMRHLAEDGRLTGILNGIDTRHHDPQTDPRLPYHFDATNLDGKARCKAAVTEELGVEAVAGRPLLAAISRLSSQKGFDILLPVIGQIIEAGASLVIQAVGDPDLATKFREAEAAWPGRFRFVEAYDPELAQRLYAGADVFLMPSHYEPCGLGQMFAMRYGTVPVVRKTGGLADTVTEGENGFVFGSREPADLLAAVVRALDAYGTESWPGLVARAMAADHSWGRSAGEYVAVYERALAARQARLVGV